jgi:Cu2+-exporting ATPase
VPAGIFLWVTIDGKDRPVCCPGCRAVAQTILDYGLEGFYQYRTGPSLKPEQPAAAQDQQLLVYDDPQLQAAFVDLQGPLCSAALILDGVVCPACTWLIESRLAHLQGIRDINVNYASRRASVTWEPAVLRLSDILKSIHSLGYRAWPFHPDTRRALLEQERKTLLRRIGLAGLLGMQVMMISVALYLGDWSGMEAGYRKFFYWVCLLLTVPVLVYSGQGFFVRAWRDLRRMRTGMDVPVALGLGVAFLGSLWSTISGDGRVYYDSVVMFIFLLLTARYLEFGARRRALRHYDDLLRIIPAMATRLQDSDTAELEERVPVVRLQQGDRLLVRPGETIAADGTIVAGATRIDESIITGESVPLVKSAGAAVIGGSTNIESPIQVIVNRVGGDTLLSSILRLVDQGRLGRPHVTELTDRIASIFVFAVILLAAGVALYWWHADQEMWLPVTVAVLVITCPCALSLATPVALTCAHTALMEQGIAVAGENALEILNRAGYVVFDKTGTLTQGRPGLHEVQSLTGKGKIQYLEIAAILEKNSEHPLAAAFQAALGYQPAGNATDIVNQPGAGLSGMVRGRRYLLGTADYIHTQTGHTLPAGRQSDAPDSQVVLADEREILCVFLFGDELRAGAQTLITTLRRQGKRTLLLSGDSHAAVQLAADTLGIPDYRSRLPPDQKREIVNDLIKAGELVVYVGDGVNDAPVLASAHASVAMGRGVDIAKLNADMILLDNNLETLARAFIHARQTARIIKQNLGWAVAYNLLALPAAVTGLVAPWLAAVGMSLSSLAVVANSLRLGRM